MFIWELEIFPANVLAKSPAIIGFIFENEEGLEDFKNISDEFFWARSMLFRETFGSDFSDEDFIKDLEQDMSVSI